MIRIDVENSLLEFAEFCRRADKIEFILVFGEHMGNHLWDKLVDEYDRDFCNLLCAMDNNNVNLLAKHLLNRILKGK